MQHPRLAVAATVALAIAACSANQPAPAPMPAPEVHAAPTAPPAPPPPPAPVAVAKPKNLKSAMKGFEDEWKGIEKQLAAETPDDLPAIASGARHIAAVMRLAYGEFEDKEVPDFAKMAHAAEAAFVDLADKAAAGDAAGIKAVAKTLQPQHCARCHDAVDEVHG